MTYRVFTTPSDMGETFESLILALKHTLEAMDKSPLLEFKKTIEAEDDDDRYDWIEYSFKIENVGTGEIIWDELTK